MSTRERSLLASHPVYLHIKSLMYFLFCSTAAVLTLLLFGSHVSDDCS